MHQGLKRLTTISIFQTRQLRHGLWGIAIVRNFSWIGIENKTQ